MPVTREYVSWEAANILHYLKDIQRQPAPESNSYPSWKKSIIAPYFLAGILLFYRHADSGIRNWRTLINSSDRSKWKPMDPNVQPDVFCHITNWFVEQGFLKVKSRFLSANPNTKSSQTSRWRSLVIGGRKARAYILFHASVPADISLQIVPIIFFVYKILLQVTFWSFDLNGLCWACLLRCNPIIFQATRPGDRQNVS